MANRKNTRGTNRDERQLSFVVREPVAREREERNEPDKFGLLIPPPSSPVSAIRRRDLAARWAADLGELAAELVAEGKLAVDQGRPARRTKERTR